MQSHTFTGQAVREKALKGNTFPRQQAQTATFCSTFSISHRTSGKSMAYQQTPSVPPSELHTRETGVQQSDEKAARTIARVFVTI